MARVEGFEAEPSSKSMECGIIILIGMLDKSANLKS